MFFAQLTSRDNLIIRFKIRYNKKLQTIQQNKVIHSVHVHRYIAGRAYIWTQDNVWSCGIRGCEGLRSPRWKGITSGQSRVPANSCHSALQSHPISCQLLWLQGSHGPHRPEQEDGHVWGDPQCFFWEGGRLCQHAR